MLDVEFARASHDIDMPVARASRTRQTTSSEAVATVKRLCQGSFPWALTVVVFTIPAQSLA